MTDIRGQDVIDAFEQAMDNTPAIMTRILGVIINEVSFRPTGNLASQTTSNRHGDIIESSSNAFYWKWWLNGRGAVQAKSGKSLRFFAGGGVVFAPYSKPFKGHKDTVEPMYEENVVKVLDDQLTRSFGNL